MREKPPILVPVRVLERESIPGGVSTLLANAHVVLLGYHVVPDQTATEQAQTQFEDRARRRLETFTAILGEAGATVETRLVFTHNEQVTIDRMIAEYDCLAVLIPNATAPPEDVLVAVRGTVGVDRIVRVVSGLFADTDVAVTLYHVLHENETEADAETLLDGVAARLVEGGLEERSLDVRIGRDGRRPQEAIVDVAEEFDAVVMGESDPSLVTLVFGMRAEQVADQFLGPVLVVQRGNEGPEADRG